MRSANDDCTAAGATVTCDLGRLEPFVQQTLAISFTIATTDVRTLTTSVAIGAPLPDANPADNTASHAGITAAPTLADLPGIPYIYSANLTEMWRVPLVGAPVNEYVNMDNNGTGGKVIATDTRARQADHQYCRSGPGCHGQPGRHGLHRDRERQSR